MSTFLSREELLRGLPARRASMLLFAIEGRTALLASRSRQAAAWYLTAKAAEERERQFLEAIAAGRDLPLQPSIQDLERFALQWAPLSPEDAGVRAALAHMIGQKYRFTYRDVPGLRSALGLDSPAVQEAFRRHYHHELESIYAPQTGPGERLHWVLKAFSSRIESLPPFWTTLILTIPGAAGLLALPIALAGVGLSTGIALIVIFGLINMLTVAALAEAVARSGTTRFGLGFLGQLVQEYLGRPGFVLLTAILALNNFFVLIIFYLGVAGTLQDATNLPQGFWAAVIFGVGLYFLTRRSLNATVTTTIVIVLINFLVTLAIPLLALPHMQVANLGALKLPFSGMPLNPSIWQLALGTMLTTYFSHILVAVYPPVVLKRDPGARSWIWGGMAAIFTLMLIACFWMLVVNGAIPSAALASTAGTVLSPLAEIVGPIVLLLGSVLVILSLGLASIQISLVIYYQANESIPAKGSGSPLSRLSERARFLLAISPVVAAFLLTEWIIFTRVGSFATFLGFLGALSLPLIGGVFPVLLLAATRRKGDYVPALVLRLLGNPLVLIGLYLVFVGSIFLNGLVLWNLLVTKILAITVGITVLGVTILMIRRGALQDRLVIELLEDQRPGEGNFLHVTDCGRPANLEACLAYRHRERQLNNQGDAIPDFQALQSVTIRLPASRARELKVWVHRITHEGRGESLPALVEMENGVPLGQFDLEKSGGQLILPLSKIPGQVKIELKNT